MVSIYDFRDYRQFLKAWIRSQAKKVKVVQSKLATAGGISSTMVSRVLSGDKHLTPEQAVEVSEFLGLNDDELKYLLLLVEIGRAGSVKLRQKLAREAEDISRKISVRIRGSKEINPQTKAVYYSSWIYSAIRNIVATPGPHSANTLAARLGLNVTTVANAVQFLVENGFCARDAGGIHYASAKTHVDSQSPFVNNHHRNWRQKAVEKMDWKEPENLFFTSPMSLSRETAQRIRLHLSRFIESTMKEVETSPSEAVYCLNLDWFEI